MTIDTTALTAFTSLERTYYTSPGIYSLEMERIFSTQWIVFGHVSDVSNPGDIRVQQIANESIIVTRDKQGELHAFFNVCRHRGSQICDPGTQPRNLVCPYHQWSYGLDGSLRGTPTMKAGIDIDRTDYPLHPAHFEIFHGFIFVALGQEPPEESVASGFEKAHDEIAGHELENLTLAHRIVYDVNCNWKLLLENFLECYHCEGSHPELCAVMTFSDFLGEVEDTIIHEGFQFGAVPVPEGLVSQSMDGSQVAPLLGRVRRDELPPVVGLIITPGLSAIQIFADYVLVLREVPVSVTQTQLVADWYVRGDAVEGQDYEIDSLVALWDVTNREDIELSERNQRGVNSRVYSPGPNSLKLERAIHEALELYKKRLGADALALT